jgi:hypothetical protein
MNYSSFNHFLKFLENNKNMTSWTHCQHFNNLEMIKSLTGWTHMSYKENKTENEKHKKEKMTPAMARAARSGTSRAIGGARGSMA